MDTDTACLSRPMAYARSIPASARNSVALSMAQAWNISIGPFMVPSMVSTASATYEHMSVSVSAMAAAQSERMRMISSSGSRSGPRSSERMGSRSSTKVVLGV